MTSTEDQPRRARPRRLARALYERRWLLFGLLVLLTVLLGYAGFWRYGRQTGQDWTIQDVFYRDLQLFVLESGGVEGSVPWQLEVARVLAPAVAGVAVLAAVAVIFRDELESLSLRRRRNHIVVCGLGRKGLVATRALRGAGERVVIVEHDPNNPRLRAARELGASVVVGDARDPQILTKARVPQAAMLLIFGPTDQLNADIAVRAGRLTATSRPRGLPSLRGVANIADPDLCALLRREELEAGVDAPYRLEFFNMFERGAQAMLREYPPDRGGAEDRGDVVVVGLGRLGGRLVVELARRWRHVPPPDAAKPRVTVIDRAAHQRAQELRRRNPQLDEVCEVAVHDVDVTASGLSTAGVRELTGTDVGTVYVCLDDDVAGFSTALLIRQALPDAVVVVRTQTALGLASLVGERLAATEYQTLRAFPLLDRACRADLLLGGTSEVIAREIHERYVQAQAQSGATPATNPAMMPWHELSETLRESNRDQAAHIGIKLRSVGCHIIPLSDWDADRFEFTPAEVEQLAELEHERWMAQRRRDGWTQAEAPKDLDAKTTPYLVPWAELAEEVRGWDRDAVRNIPRLLADVGYQIARQAQ